MTPYLRQSGQKAKKRSVPEKKEVLHVARLPLMGQREAEAAKKARADDR